MRRHFGSSVTIEYVGALSSGEVFDQKINGDSLSVVLGAGAVPQALERALFDMELGEERELVVPPEEGFGEYEPRARFEVPLIILPEWESLPVGEYIEWYGKNKRPAIAKVLEVNNEHAVIDLNHPLAGETIQYWVKIIDENVDTDESFLRDRIQKDCIQI